MAITWSKGYYGQVLDTDVPTWARALGGLDYAVRDTASWRVAPVPASARAVQVSAGGGCGRGISDVSSGGDQVEIPNPAAGQMWHLVVARRMKGETNATTFTWCAGATDPWAAIALRDTFESTAGATDDQPLALVRVAKDVSAIQESVDLRCWQANGGAIGASDYVRGYLNREGTVVHIGEVTWAAHAGTAGLDWRMVGERSTRSAAGFAVTGGVWATGSGQNRLARSGGRWLLDVHLSSANAGSFSAGAAPLGTIPAEARVSTGGVIFAGGAYLLGPTQIWRACPVELNLATGAVRAFLPTAHTNVAAGQFRVAFQAQWDAS